MNCLCCGRPLRENTSGTGWHDSCIRSFFGTGSLPELDISEETLLKIAAESTGRGYTVPGVQKKMSLHLDRTQSTPRLTMVDYPTGYILKPQTESYPSLPEAEYLVMQMARETGIATVPFALIRIQNGYAYITKRIDRLAPNRKSPAVELMAMEDFCQLERRLTEDKYKGSYERCARVVSRYSTRAGLDLSELFLRIVFSYVVGNSDMHLKNFSLIETSPGSQEYILSEAYDMLPVNIVLSEDQEELALTLNVKKRNLRRNDYLHFADASGIPRPAAEKMIRKVISMRDRYCAMCESSYLPEEMKTALIRLMDTRIQRLS